MGGTLNTAWYWVKAYNSSNNSYSQESNSVNTPVTVYSEATVDKQLSVNSVNVGYNIQAWPNPFNPSVTIAVSLPQESHIHLVVYDIQGRVVQELQQGVLSTGSRRFSFTPVNTLASGVYVVRLEYRSTDHAGHIHKKIVLLR